MLLLPYATMSSGEFSRTAGMLLLKSMSVSFLRFVPSFTACSHNASYILSSTISDDNGIERRF